MRNLSFILLLFVLVSCQEQGENIPIPEINPQSQITDPGFVKALVEDYGFVSQYDRIFNEGKNNKKFDSITELNLKNKGIKSLDGLKFFSRLKVVDCSNNELQSISIDNMYLIRKLNCSNNKITAQGLKLGVPGAVTELICNNNEIESLEFLQQCENLEKLVCHSNKIPVLDVHNNKKLLVLECYNNNLSALDISLIQPLSLLCGEQKDGLTLTMNRDQKGLFDATNEKNKRVNINVTEAVIDSYWANTLKNNFGFVVENSIIDPSNPTNQALFTTINELVINDSRIKSISGISNFTNLTKLTVRESIPQIDLSSNTALRYLDISENKTLTSIDLSINTQLTYLVIYETGITKLDVSKLINLTHLNCSVGSIETLDVSKNIKLDTLACHSNKLTSLNVSNNQKLTLLSCGSNQIGSLDLSNNPKMKTLYCNGNNLARLDLTNNPSLFNLLCYGNRLTELDIRSLNALSIQKSNFNCGAQQNNQELYLWLTTQQHAQWQTIKDLPNNSNVRTSVITE